MPLEQQTLLMTSNDLQKNAYFLSTFLHIGLLLGIGYVVLGIPIDHFFYPDLFGTFVIIRIIAAVCLIALLILCYRPLVYRIPYTLSFLASITLCLLTSIIIMLSDGAASHYYLGLSFVLFATAIFQPGAPKKLFGLFLIMIAVYILACLWNDPKQSLLQDSAFVYRIVFLGLTFCVSFIAHTLLPKIFKFHLLIAFEQKLEERYQQKQKFFSNTIHEIRNALTLVILPLEQLQRKSQSLPDTLKRHIETAHSNSNYLLKLSEELLELSRKEHHSNVLSKQLINFGGFVFETVNTIRPLAEEKKLSLSIKQCAESIFIQADKALLRKALLNLLSNAIKFTPSGGKVDVTISLSGSDVLVRIKDTGKGITQEELDNIFERFYQSPNNTSSQKGVGIGLALVREIIHRHGGVVNGESNLKKGTTFTFSLPIILQDKNSSKRIEALKEEHITK